MDAHYLKRHQCAKARRLGWLRNPNGFDLCQQSVGVRILIPLRAGYSPVQNVPVNVQQLFKPYSALSSSTALTHLHGLKIPSQNYPPGLTDVSTNCYHWHLNFIKSVNRGIDRWWRWTLTLKITIMGFFCSSCRLLCCLLIFKEKRRCLLH